MNDLKETASVATLIGDVVGSRSSADRRALHRSLGRALDDLNETLRPTEEFRVTVGDEFQGCFATVGEALGATLRIRLALHPVDVRLGLGWGPVEVLTRKPRVEDGPGWWAARAAIDWAKQAATKPAMREVRTAYRRADDVEGSGPEPVNAALLLRDFQLGGLSDRSVAVLQHLLAGRTQAEIAERLGVSASAVSQRIRSDGLGMIISADDYLGKVR